MGGTIALIGQELARYHAFTIAMRQLKVPPDSTWTVKLGFQVAKHRNEAVREMQGDWLFFLDDDQTFEPDILLQLLERNVDIVQALTPARTPPYAPLAFIEESGRVKRSTGNMVPETGMSKWVATGCGCLLIRRQVFEKIEAPWFETNGYGETDDVYFCRKARAAGFDVWLDSDNRSGHMMVGEVMPTYQNGRWTGTIKAGAV